MELKVWVEGIQRIICGVTEYTTCQDIVYALAHATGQTGRFTLIERWRNNERLLAPHEHPLKILNKWGEYSNDVQFVLQRTSIPSSNVASSPNTSVFSDLSSPSKINANSSLYTKDGVSDGPYGSSSGSESGRNLKKSLTISTGGGYQNHRVGVVRGVPQQRLLHPSPGGSISPDLKSASQPQPPPPYREPPRPKSPGQPQQQPPPYRAPPSPLGTPLEDTKKLQELSSPASSHEDSFQSSTKYRKNEEESSGEKDESADKEVTTTNITLTPQYKELLRLVNQQREKLGSLQADLTKYDAEITFWESKTREQQHKAEFIAQEGGRLQETNRVLEDQLIALKNIEEEKEISKQQSKTLKSEITLLRSKLANCETELLQCKIKIRRLLEELQLEQRAVAREEEDHLHDGGAELLKQLEQLQRDLDEAMTATARDMAAGSELDQEVEALEKMIREKKQQVEQLVHDMKEANLHSLSISPATDDGVRSHLLEGLHKPGSSRRMIGSPRQLENAVPTSKNPHGVWV